MDLRAFVKESNRIEGIRRAPLKREIEAHELLLGLERLTVEDVERFVAVVAPGKPLRSRVGMNVYVGRYTPPGGGRNIQFGLMQAMDRMNRGYDPYGQHQAYEALHPFMDGNGRSGRALWLWQMIRQVQDPHVLSRGFLHTFYYQALAANSERHS